MQHVPDELDPEVDWITTPEVAELLGAPGFASGNRYAGITSPP